MTPARVGASFASMRASSTILAVLLCLTARAAEAASDELVLAIEPGYDRLSRTEASQNGVGGTATAWFGLTDSLWLLASGGAFQMLDEDPGRDRLLRWEAFGGIVAALDVFRVVPHLELAGGVVGGRGGVHPTIRVGVGADYLFTPEWSAGVALRYRPLPEEDIAQASVTAQLRVGYRFAW